MDALPIDPRKQSMPEIYRQQAEAVERENRTEWTRRLTEVSETLRENDRDPEAYIEIAWCHRKLGEHAKAIAVLQEGLSKCGLADSLCKSYVNLLEECNRTGEAIDFARQASLARPDNFLMKLKEALLLPVVYDTAEEVDFYRRRFAKGLERVRGELKLDTTEARRRAVSALRSHSNVLLGYQGRNDRELQVQYGDLVHQIMAASYPHWMQLAAMPPLPPGERLRVGYVSSRFRNLSAAKYFLGWLRWHSRERMAIHAYYVGAQTDSVTEEVRRLSERFHHEPYAFEETCRAILADNLHALVFLDVGLDPFMTQLAALRLAPIQCAAWDQPVTSGLPTVEYFLSSALAEPEQAADHYSEELVRLPGVGVCFEKPVIPTVLLSKTRRDFRVRDDAVVYLCCQYAFKYLPDQDSLFVQIASRVSKAQFVFLTENEEVAEDLRKRLDRAFAAAGLRADDHCVLLPAVDRLTYWNLYLIGDVVLDTIGWSGGVSTFEAIACRLPVVTLPGSLMRGRQSSAILTQLGVTDTIVRDRAEYVEIAVRLGLDHAWRGSIIERMTAQSASLYGDRRSVAALEDFFQRVVDERLQKQRA
jgi:protein O-GlcNAc transferase